MEFTNDIRFSRRPTANQFLRISYFGKLTKEDSLEMYITYGFGESWEHTTEQKMEPNGKGFSVKIKMENYNTLNFCFRNEKYNWDNNNSFNYIAQIVAKSNYSKIKNLSEENSKEVCNGVIDNLIDCIDMDLDKPIQTITPEEGNDVLDTLIQELCQEYAKTETAIAESLEEKTIAEPAKIENSQTVLPQNTQEYEITETDFDKLFDELYDEQEISKIESYEDLSNLFDKIISDIEEKNPQKQTVAEPSDLGKELNNLFEKTFTSDFENVTNTTDAYIPETCDEDVFETKLETKTQAIVTTEDEEQQNTISQVETKTEEIEENIFNFSDLDFDFNYGENTIQEIEQTAVQTVETYQSNDFSDSFYDDQDLSIHEAYTNFQQIVNSVADELEQEMTKQNLFEDEAFQKENEEFENSISEYTEYFDNLIDEIIKTPTSTLSTPVSTEEVLEAEKTNLVAVQDQGVALAEDSTNSFEQSSDAVPDEYALFDYKSHSFLYMIKRRFKIIFTTLFTKLPKIFNGETDSDNY